MLHSVSRALLQKESLQVISTMSSTQIDTILDLYKQLARNPTLTSAKIVSGINKGITIQSRWSQRNLERCKKQTFAQDFTYDANLQPLVESFPLDVTSEILTTSSEDEKLKAILRDVTTDGKSKQFIEIWDKQHLIKSYDLSAFDVHQDVYYDSTFSSFHWSPDNTRLLYIAEKKLPKCEPFYKQKSKSKVNNTTDEEEPSRGTEYVYKPDWGEQLVGKHRSVVVILNIKDDTITPLDSIPEEYFPGQVIWTPNGDAIVGVVHKLYPRYLGLMFCTNRESYIFHLKETKFRKLTAEGLSCRSPRFSPDGKYLVWLEREISPPHNHVQRLTSIKWNVQETPDVLIDVVKTHVVITNNKKFYGLYNQSLPMRCWSDDSKYMFFSTLQRSSVKSYIIKLETKVVTEIDNADDSSLTILDVRKNHVVLSKSSVIKSSQLVLGKFDSAASDTGNLHLFNCTSPLPTPNEETLMYNITEFTYENNEPVKDFNFIYLGKTNGTEKSMPLIVTPHGGPHSTFSNEFSLSYAVFALLGFGVLKVNYRGSIGMGEDNVKYLLGKIGKADVLDCMTAMYTALKLYPWLDPKKVTLFGGSHGGFLSAHLSGQHPEAFRAVVMRNPVIEVATTFSISDIPDWAAGETGCSAIGKAPEKIPEPKYSQVIEKMLSHSPFLLADKVKAPTLIALGSNDLRVPSSQGKLWYYRLSVNNVITKLHMYDDNHSLTKDEVEIDFVINTALWMLEHTGDKTKKDLPTTEKQ